MIDHAKARQHIRAQILDTGLLLGVFALALLSIHRLTIDAINDQWTWMLWLASTMSLMCVCLLWRGHKRAPECECFGGEWE